MMDEASLSLFELDWLGGYAERHFRRSRGDTDALPWGTLEPSRFAPDLVAAARESWTEGAINEYCTAAAFADIIKALLEVRAPIDLVAMAGAFIARRDGTRRAQQPNGDGAGGRDAPLRRLRPTGAAVPARAGRPATDQRAHRARVLCRRGAQRSGAARHRSRRQPSAHPRGARAHRRRRGPPRQARLALPGLVDGVVHDR